MGYTPNNSTQQSFFAKAKASFKTFWIRFFVHICALLCADALSSTAPTKIQDTVLIAGYGAILCLVARETRLAPAWLFPAIAGSIQVLIGFLFGLPFYQSLFWGGVLAYALRLLVKEGRMGLEWIVLLLLLPSAFELGALLKSPMFTFGGLVAFGIINACGWVVYQRTQKVTQTTETNKTPPQKTTKHSFGTPEQEPDPFAAYRTSIFKIRRQQMSLPNELQTALQKLTVAAEGILQCMKEDKRDVENGERFLKRYLPAVHAVLDKYQRFAKEANNNTNIRPVLTECGELLERLAEAFTNEQKSLMRNDIDDFSADLKVLDTLLKMDGR